MALEIRRGDERSRAITGQVTAGKEAPRITEMQHQAFDAALTQSVRNALRTRETTAKETGRISKPRHASSGIFDLIQSQEILSFLITEVLPQLDMDEEVTAIAKVMLTEEIEFRRDIQSRLTEAQEL